MMQILIEAVVLAMAGGAMGVGVGALVTTLLSRVFDISMKITPAYVILSITVSSVGRHRLRMVSGVARREAGPCCCTEGRLT